MNDPLVFGRFELRPAQRLLLQNGERVALGTRAFDLLSTLVAHRDRVVTKEELLRQVWPGLVVEENNLTVHMSTLRRVLGSDAVSTVIGTGYRFTLPVAAPLPAPHHEKPSIAVLPFAHDAGGARHRDFIDGITDELITELSRFHALFVISRNSVFAYQGRPVDVRTVARELGVRYVLEGSVHRSAQRVRIAAHLIDATSGQQIWAERYDREMHNLFALQDAIAHAIVAAIAPHIENLEMVGHPRGGSPPSPTAYGLVQQAGRLAREGLSRSSHAARDEAIALARQALALDPQLGAAWNTIVDAQSWHLYFATAPCSKTALSEGLHAVAQALAIDSADHLAYRGRGWLMLVGGQLPEAHADFRRAWELNPNDAVTLARLGMCESVSGHAERGLQRCLDALRLSPRDPARFHLLDNLAWAQFAARRYADAIDSTGQSLREADFNGSRLCRLLSRVGLGDVAQAAAELKDLQQRAPAMVAARLSGVWLATDAEVRQREVDFLHAAHTHAAPPEPH